jgi:hypothetical protein
MWVLILFHRDTTIDDDNQYEWRCPNIVWDTNVTVVADVTVVCYQCYRMYLWSTIDEIVSVGATIYFFLTPKPTAIDFFLNRSTVTV